MRITCEDVEVSVVTDAEAAAGGGRAGGPTVRRILGPVGIDLECRHVSVIGANGSGKSTFLKLFNALVTPTAGALRVGGLDPVTQTSEVRRKVGFVFTDPATQLVMPTAVEDVELSLRRRKLPRTTRRAAALEVLDRLGVADLADRSVYSLSGGQRQLVALAAVLAVEPALLVLDEPTTLLDLRNRELFYSVVERLVGEGIHVWTATHDLELATRAEHSVLFTDGVLTASGAPTEVVATYREQVAR